MGLLDGKVAFITGAARGQGRSHAVRLAEEGASIIAVDICEDIESNPYPMSSWEDLEETRRLVEKSGSSCVAIKADVRERRQLADALAQGVSTFGRLTTVCANAGILPMAMGDPQPTDFQDAVDVDLIGVMNAVRVAIPHVINAGREGSVLGFSPVLIAEHAPLAGPVVAQHMGTQKPCRTVVEGRDRPMLNRRSRHKTVIVL